MINASVIKDRIANRINIHSLKTRLILSILMIFMVMILIILINNIIAVNIVTQKTNDSIINSVRQTNNYITLLLKKAKDSSFAISLNESLLNYSQREYCFETMGYEDVKLSQDMDRLMVSNIGLTNEIASIFIYFENSQKLLISNQGIYNYKEVKQYNWMKIAQKINSPFSWVGYFYDENFSNKHLISIITRADLINKNIKSKVYVGINFDENAINNVIKNVAITPNSKVYLIDANQVVVSTEDKNILGKKIRDVIDVDLNQLEKPSFQRIENDENYQMIFQKNTYANWGILSSIPEKELLAEQKTFWYAILVVIILLSIIIIFITYRIVNDYVNKPVNKLVMMMKQVETGNFSHQIVEKRRDEFGYLYESYNSMVNRTGQLIKELYEEKLLKKEIELRVLQSQINPHFLYNTLECINWIAKANKVDDISNVVVALSNLYRATFNHGDDFAKVSTVIQTIENYLYIQKFRFGNKFDYTIEVDKDAEEIIMPNLLIQPIVENAVLHGVGECSRKGTIKFSISLEDNLLCMVITDDGVGMSAEKLELLKRSIMRPGSSGGSAIRNVQKRIELFYGAEYGLTLNSTKDRGTIVTIKIPYFNYTGLNIS